MPNHYPREDMHQMVTTDDVARLEALTLPNNSLVRHEDHHGTIVNSSRQADIQGIVVRGHQALHRASTKARDDMNEAAKHDFRHVVDVEGIKEQMNDAAVGWQSHAEDIDI